MLFIDMLFIGFGATPQHPAAAQGDLLESLVENKNSCFDRQLCDSYVGKLSRGPLTNFFFLNHAPKKLQETIVILNLRVENRQELNTPISFRMSPPRKCHRTRHNRALLPYHGYPAITPIKCDYRPGVECV